MTKKVVKAEINPEDVEKLADKYVSLLADKFVEILKNNIEEMDVVATGHMKRSIVKRKIRNGEYLVRVDVPYANYVEYGTRPHKPPKRKIYEWAKVKFKMNDKDAWRMANAVIKKIMREGTMPHPFFRKSYYELMHYVNGRFVKVERR